MPSRSWIALAVAAVAVALASSSLAIAPALASPGTLTIAGSTWGSQQSPMAVEPGSTYAPFTVYLANMGQGLVENASITIYTSYPLSLAPGAKGYANFTLIPPGSSVPAVFYLNVSPTASDGVYTVSAFVNYTVVTVTNVTSTTHVYNYTEDLQVPVTAYASPVAYNAYWGSPSSPSYAYPGSRDSTLVVVMGNSGDAPAYNVTVVASSGPGQPIELVTESFHAGTIPPGAQVPISFIASVPSGATTGVYPLNLTIYYNYGASTSATVEVPVLLAPKVALQGYGLPGGNAFPGDRDVALQVYLVNEGNATAQDASVQLVLPQPLQQAYPGSLEETVGPLPPGQPVPVTFRFSVPSSATSPLNATAQLLVNYSGGSASFQVPIHVSSLANFTASIYSSQPLAQGSSNVKEAFEVTNDGNVTAKYVEAQLLLPNGLSGNTFTYVGDLAPGSSGLATFGLDVSSSTPPGTYTATLEVTWLQSNAQGRQFTQDIPVTFTVGPGLLTILEPYIPWMVLVVVVAIVVVAAIVRLRRSR